MTMYTYIDSGLVSLLGTHGEVMTLLAESGTSTFQKPGVFVGYPSPGSMAVSFAGSLDK